MARSETASLIVSLIDRVSGPARAASASIRGIADAARAADGTAMGRLNAAIATNNRALDVMRGRMVEAVAGFIGLREALRAPVSAAMNFETMLEDIGQKAGLSGAPLAALGQQIREVARQTNLSATEMGKSIDAVIGLGLNAPDALSIASSIGKVAVAYRAAADDVGRAGVAALQNLKVAPTEIMAAFDAMAKAGKEGAFELKDMAQYFPQLTAQAQNLGIVGVKGVADLAAALQITRRGAGDASEAATNLRNVLQKIEAPATRKNFKKFGIDVSKEIAAGLKAGVSPIETIANLTKRAMDKGAKLSDLFEDAQVQSGLLALMQNIEEYRRISAEALKASGMVEEDFQRRIKTSAAAVARFQASIENLNIAIGTALLPGLTELTDLLGEHANKVATLAEKYPSVTRSIVAVTAGLMGLKVAGTAVAYGARLAWGGLLMVGKGALFVVAPLLAIGRAASGAIKLQRALAAMSGMKLGFFGTIATGLRGIVQAIPLIGAALAGVTAPVAATIAAVVAVVAGGAVLIWKYWDRIIAVASGVATRLGEALAPVAGAVQPYLQPVLDYLGNIASWIGEKLAPIGSVISNALGSVGRWISELLTPERLDASGKADWSAWGYSLADGLVNAIKERVGELVSWFAGLPGRILAAVGSIDIGALIKWPTLPSWMGGGGSGSAQGAPSSGAASSPAGGAETPSTTPAPRLDGARATGGPVRAYGQYLVGERGPEIFVPAQRGTIIPNHRLDTAPQGSPDAAAPVLSEGKGNLPPSAPGVPGRPASDPGRVIEPSPGVAQDAYPWHPLDAQSADVQAALPPHPAPSADHKSAEWESGPAQVRPSFDGSESRVVATAQPAEPARQAWPQEMKGSSTARTATPEMRASGAPTTEVNQPAGSGAAGKRSDHPAPGAVPNAPGARPAPQAQVMPINPITPALAPSVPATPALPERVTFLQGGEAAAPIFRPDEAAGAPASPARVGTTGAGDKAEPSRSITSSVSLAPVFHIQGGNTDDIVSRVMREMETLVRGAQRDLMGDYGLDPA